MRVYTFKYFVPESEEEGTTINDALIAIKNGDFKSYDLQFLADDRESDVYCEVNVYDS